MESAMPTAENSLRTYRRVLSVAGSDSGGGAGIQADLKTFSALGCYGTTAVTALTAQNTQGVTGIQQVPASFVQAQMDAVLSDIGTDAVKIGMLFSTDIIWTVSQVLAQAKAPRVVLDPVMVAQSGDKLLEDRAIEVMCRELMPLADLITPNLPEAEAILERKIPDLKSMQRAVRDLCAFGSKAVLLKGGHLQDSASVDLLYLREGDRCLPLHAEHVSTINNHGTGCTLSSAVAAFLARGMEMEEAVGKGKEYITRAIQAGASYRLGRGHGPVHHFYAIWE
jgi:hydroxymethylpyrimidine/phosphomethylpyrimidine kinase